MKILLIILLVLIVLVLGVLMYLLTAPIVLKIDSRKGIVALGWHKWLQARIKEKSGKMGILVRLPFWSSWLSAEDHLFKKKTSKEALPERKKPARKRFGKGMKWRKFIKIIRQIRIVEFKWILDTDNFIWNAYMSPLFEILNTNRGFNTHISFTGRNEIKIYAKCRLIRMLRASIL